MFADLEGRGEAEEFMLMAHCGGGGGAGMDAALVAMMEFARCDFL